VAKVIKAEDEKAARGTGNTEKKRIVIMGGVWWSLFGLYNRLNDRLEADVEVTLGAGKLHPVHATAPRVDSKRSRPDPHRQSDSTDAQEMGLFHAEVKLPFDLENKSVRVAHSDAVTFRPSLRPRGDCIG